MTEAGPFLPYGRQRVEEEDIAAVADVLRGDFLTTGPAVDGFESALAERTGAHEAVACSSGTAALHLAMLALGLGPGDIAIVPAITFLATANAARFCGAEVVFADVDPDTGLMRPEDFDRALNKSDTGNIKTVLPVHLGGQACDMPAISEIAARHGIAVVEDACHAIGTSFQDGNETRRVGECRYSDMAAFSFHPVKTIAMGEGGAVTTNNAELAERLRLMRNHGMTRDETSLTNDDLGRAPDGSLNPWYYEMSEIGFNYRASDIHCALGLSQLGRLDQAVARRRELVARYDAALAQLGDAIRPTERVPGNQPGWHLYVALIDFDGIGKSRAEIMTQLRSRGIGTQVHYIPVHLQPYYRDRYPETILPGAMEYYRRCLSLPLFSGMEDSDVDRVIAALSEVLGGE